MNNVYGRNWHIGSFRKIGYQIEKLWFVVFMHFFCVVHFQEHFVRVPIAEQVHANGNHKSNYHPAGSTEHKADANKQACHGGQ